VRAGALTPSSESAVAGALTIGAYHGLLIAAGFVGISITATIGHGDGIYSAIIQATKAAITAAPGLTIAASG
jgi:hypothetical protein